MDPRETSAGSNYARSVVARGSGLRIRGSEFAGTEGRDRSDDIERLYACREGTVRVSEGPNFPGEVWLEVGSRFYGQMTPAQVVAQHAAVER